MADGFAVHLGGGVYLDASGNIVFGPPSKAQIYQPPGGFRLDTKKIQDAFKDLSDILPRNDDGKKKWTEWGVPSGIVDFLSKIAGAAGIVATAISVYVWAIGVLITLMNVLAADDGMSPELGRALLSIKSQLQGVEEIDRATNMIAMHAQFDGNIDKVSGLLTRLVVENPTGTARAQIFSEMRDVVDQLAVPLSNLRDQEWATTYDPDQYKGRGFASMLLVFEKSDGTLPGVPMQAPNVTVFDYRLGVPMLLYGATAFTSLVQIAMPWFRSAGMYAGQLRKTADAIDRIVLRMQDECLSRTQYTANIVLQQETWPIQDIATPVGGPRPFPPIGDVTYAVGAFDLVAYNDAFLVDRYVAEFQAKQATGPRGLFNYNWTPPSGTLEDVATAANEQSEQDYANLQTATGMFRLISTAAWLRFLSTPPTQSQTISGFAVDSRTLVDEAPTTATSPPILFHDVVKHAATLKRYNARNRIRITTQEAGYVPAFRYKVLLRTVDTVFGKEGWRSRDYVRDIWQADYEPTAADARCQRLKTDFQQGLILSEIALFEGPAPSQPYSLPVTHASMQAATFDWYLPVVSPRSRFLGTVDEALHTAGVSDGVKKQTIGTGGVSIHLMGSQSLAPEPMHVLSNPSPLVTRTIDDLANFDPFIVGISDVALDKAERRHVKIETVDFDWQLNWSGDQLEIRLFGKPASRPFQCYVVVEETVYSGETAPENLANVLGDAQLVERVHTPFVAEMVNQIVFVPEEFFVEERKAIDEANKIISEFQRRYSISGHVGPGDPIEYLQQSIRELMATSPSTSTIAASLDKRAEFAAQYAPQIWNEVLRNAGRGNAPQ
jgi:hypothetical protein